MDMRHFNPGGSRAGAGRKKTITDERLRHKSRSISVTDAEYELVRKYIASLRQPIPQPSHQDCTIIIDGRSYDLTVDDLLKMLPDILAIQKLKTPFRLGL